MQPDGGFHYAINRIQWGVWVYTVTAAHPDSTLSITSRITYPIANPTYTAATIWSEQTGSTIYRKSHLYKDYFDAILQIPPTTFAGPYYWNTIIIGY